MTITTDDRKYRSIILQTFSLLLVLALTALPAQAQMQGQGDSDDVTLTLIPRAGVSVPGVAGFGDIFTQVGEVFQGGPTSISGGLSLGYESRERVLNGRLTGIYRRKTTIPTFTGSTKADISYTAITADLVVRPLSGIVVQPYLIAGVGAHKLAYYGSQSAAISSDWELAVQTGLGLDVQLHESGYFLGVELLDYLANVADDADIGHSAFLTVTVGIPLF
ncbi:MAG: hypothetical protein U5K31_08585 [Balneolaceae bacterium]|nr:hypothetical protein [Balneolaceae bacterium]